MARTLSRPGHRRCHRWRVESDKAKHAFSMDAPEFYADEQPVGRTSLADLDRGVFASFLEKEYSLTVPEGDDLAVLAENLNIARSGKLTLAGLFFLAVTRSDSARTRMQSCGVRG